MHVCVCVRMWECMLKPFEVLIHYTLPRVSSLFEDYVAMIIKTASFDFKHME